MRCASSVVRIELERLFRGVDRFGGLVLARVEAGDLGADLGGLGIERLRPLERLERARLVALRLELPRQHELEIRLGRAPAAAQARAAAARGPSGGAPRSARVKARKRILGILPGTAV